MAIKFGVQVWQEEFELEEYAKTWRDIEDLGYYSVWNYDHFYPMANITSLYLPEAWTLLPYLAANTKRIRIGVLVSCNSYRYPSILAKIASTVDVISNGRLEFGIGAGWHKPEYDAYGIPFPPAKVRIEQMDEATEIIKRIWTQEEASFKGKYYSIQDLVSYPKPVQKPYPPIMIGGKGNFTLRVAAKHADNLNIVDCSPKQYEERVGAFKERCSEIGKEFGDVTMSWHGHVIVGDTNEAKRMALKLKEGSVIKAVQDSSEEDFLSWAIWGTPEACIDKIQEYVDVGVSYFVCHFPFPGDLDPYRVFMDQVAPSFK